MVTRAAAAREAAFVESSLQGNKQREDLVSAGDQNGISGASRYGSKAATRKGVEKRSCQINKVSGDSKELTADASGPIPLAGKRKRASQRDVTKKEVVKGGWDELPHNMGNNETRTQENVSNVKDELQHDSATIKMEDLEEPASKARKIQTPQKKSERNSGTTSKAKSNRKATGMLKSAGPPTPASFEDTLEDPVAKDLKAEAKEEPGVTNSIKPESREVKTLEADTKDESDYKDDAIPGNPTKRRQSSRARKSQTVDTSTEVLEKVDNLVSTATSVKAPKKQTSRPKKERTPRKKRNPYGLTPGETPFPDFQSPTKEQCYEVSRLLSDLHGAVEAPKEIPQPSLEVTGCGEVPSVIDALIRTLLSAATTGQNSRYAFTGLVEKFGICEDGIGKGSVNWNKVREAPLDQVELAIRRGGLSKAKSKNIKKILDMVYENNKVRREAFVAEKESGQASGVVGSDTKSQKQKDMEIEAAESNVLSLQYMHGLSSEDAMMELVKLPGIGVKTSSCVILFCLQRPSFAVDTHVWRLCKWLKWVPEGANRDQTFSHCEVRIPNELKYGLHQLLIRHGKTCIRCRAAISESNEGWADANCPIDDLVERSGARKGGDSTRGGPTPKKQAAKRGKKGKVDAWECDSEIEDRVEDDDEEVPTSPELHDDDEVDVSESDVEGDAE